MYHQWTFLLSSMILLTSRTTTTRAFSRMARPAPRTTRCFSSCSDRNGDSDINDNAVSIQSELLTYSKSPLSAVLPKDHLLWQDYYLPPPPTDVMDQLEPGQRVVTFGDVHGDIDALQEFLWVAGVLEPTSSLEHPQWSGGSTICVQVGDVLDRGDEELACWRLLTSLARQAQEAGGGLYLLYGNHETLNTAGLFQYANPGGNQEYEETLGRNVLDAAVAGESNSSSGANEVLQQPETAARWRLQFAGNQPSRWAAMEPGGLLAEPLLQNMRVSLVVGRTCFVHAGLTAHHLKQYGGSLENMNRAASEWVVQNHHGDNNNLGLFQDVNDIIQQAQQRASAAAQTMPSCLGGGSGSEASPVWMRSYSSPPDMPPTARNAQRIMDDCLRELGPDVQRMVMGHTPQQQINAALQNKAWRVDVGASKGVMGGTPQVLEIWHGIDEDEIRILTQTGSIRVDLSEGTDVEQQEQPAVGVSRL